MLPIDKWRSTHCATIAASLLLSAGCAGEVQAQAPEPAVAYGDVAPGTPAVDPIPDDVAYDAEPPVVDIGSYPSVVFDGVTVFYVGGRWYRHDARGWGYYRNEPAGLARQREQHATDPRWVDARERRPEPTPKPGVAEPQRVEPRVDGRIDRQVAPQTAGPQHAQPAAQPQRRAPAQQAARPARTPRTAPAPHAAPHTAPEHR